MVDLIGLHITSNLLNFEPVHVSSGRAYSLDRLANGRLYRFRGGAHHNVDAISAIHVRRLARGANLAKASYRRAMRRTDRVHVPSVTGAAQGLSQEQDTRTRKYLISMGIRTACVLGAIVIPGWPRWVLIAGAVVLPYLAVVIANSSGKKSAASVDRVTFAELPSSPVIESQEPAQPEVIAGEVIDPAQPSA